MEALKTDALASLFAISNTVLGDAIGGSLVESALMFWETLWPLVLGFGIAGIVQACASRDGMEKVLGNHRAGAISRAAGYGMLSSSCSYAASAMTKNLVVKGADFITAMVFMVASTNLVIEIGLVLIALMGWQFAVAEFVGGPIMIVLLALLGTLLFPAVVTRPAQQRLQRKSDASSSSTSTAEPSVSLAKKLRTPATWANAASYTLADLTMLRKELLIGFLVAGALTSFVPDATWEMVFAQGHGLWTSIQNAFIGPLIAVISFVCSVGNVALAASLWQGGISFGGVVAFIFGDLITLPLLLIYRKYYGPQLALRMWLGLWLVMSVSGLLVELIFSHIGLIPAVRQTATAQASFAWNSTTWLNLVAMAALLGASWLARNKERFGGGSGYAIDPICGMQVEIANAPAHRCKDHTDYWFCSDHCADKFDQAGAPEPKPQHHKQVPTTEASPCKDPVCGMDVDPATAKVSRTYGGTKVFFCGNHCAEKFDQNPTQYCQPSADCKDPVCGMSVDPATAKVSRTYSGTTVFFCGSHCGDKFDQDPERYLKTESSHA